MIKYISFCMPNDTKLQNIQLQLLHNILPVNSFIYQRGLWEAKLCCIYFGIVNRFNIFASLFKMFYWFVIFLFYQGLKNCIGDVMVSLLASSVVDRGFQPRSGQTKNNEIGSYCFSAKYATLRKKSKRLVGSESE